MTDDPRTLAPCPVCEHIASVRCFAVKFTTSNATTMLVASKAPYIGARPAP